MCFLVNDFFTPLEDFVAYRQAIYGVSPQTIRSNRCDLNLFDQFLHTAGIEQIDGPAVIKFQHYLAEQRGNSGASLNRKIFTLRSYARFLQLAELPDADRLPFHLVAKVRGGYRQPPAALTKAQLRTLFAALDRTTILGIRDYCAYALMYHLGLRVGEVAGLDLDNYQPDAATLVVRGKGNRRRTLRLTPDLNDLLAEYLAVRPSFLNHDRTTALFLSKKGNRLAIRTLQDNFAAVVRTAKLDLPVRITCHTLRHSFASHLNDAEVDILVIQTLLGHSSPRTTAIYIHPSETKIRQALERIPALVEFTRLLNNGIIHLSFQKPRIRRLM